MITYKNIFKPAIEVENIEKCIIDGAKDGKMQRPEVKEVVDNVKEESAIVHDMMKNHTTEIGPYKLVEITEGIKQKKRKIAKPKYKYDQIVQLVLISQLRKIVMHSLYEYAHGSLEKRGPMQSAEVISKWIKNDPKGTRYCLQMDVHHCYPSVDQENLIERYHRVIKDDDFNIENDKVIRASPQGLAPGAPTSVWHIHFLFTPFDHWMTEQDGVVHYLRHADDIIAFGPSKKKLHKVERDAIEYMRREYHMEINHNHQVFPIEWKDKRDKKHGRPLDVCGCLFYRDRTILREAHLIKITRKANKIAKKDKITHHDAAQMLSHMGWIDHTDTYHAYEERIKPKVSIRKLKRIASKHARKENKKREMENSNGLYEAAGNGSRKNNGIPAEKSEGGH